MSHEAWVPRCAICNESVNLEESKTDERGKAVHENCYIWTVESKKLRRFTTRIDSGFRGGVVSPE